MDRKEGKDNSKPVPPKFKDMSKEQQKAMLIKKKECDARAQKIVECFVETSVSEQTFLRCLPYLNQSHYQDIAEERAIAGICGYPVCGNILPKMPNKQYYISTRRKKVYDITDRKNYCSNSCYTAGIFIKDQMLTSPLWFRDKEAIPDFELLPKQAKIIPGEIVVQGLSSIDDEEDQTVTGGTASTSSSAGLGKQEEKPPEKKSLVTDSCKVDVDKRKITEAPKHCEQNPKVSIKTDVQTHDIPFEYAEARRVCQRYINAIDEETENSDDSQDESDEEAPVQTTRRTLERPVNRRKEKPSLPADSVDHFTLVAASMTEWITFNTFVFLLGEGRVKESVRADVFREHVTTAKQASQEATRERKYLEICRKLNILELEDNKADRVLTGEERKPLPNYEQLKKESTRMNLKVFGFYQGIEEMEDSGDESDYSAKEADTGESLPAVLPLVDSQAQIALRRKVFMSALNRTLSPLLERVGIDPVELAEPLRDLVLTFQLKAHNVTFRTSQWPLVAVSLVKILAVRDESLASRLQGSTKFQTHLETILRPLGKTQHDLDELIRNKCDIELYIGKLE